jgi:hypothetical protein
MELISKQLIILYKGHFSESVAKQVEAVYPNLSKYNIKYKIDFLCIQESTLIIALSSPNFRLLKELAEKYPTNYLIISLFLGKYVLISPILREQQCIECFRKRFLSSPPAIESSHDPLTSLVHYCEADSDFEFDAFHPAAPSLAANLLLKQIETRGTLFSLVDVAGFTIKKAHLTPVHGCSCRQKQNIARSASDRFIQFSNSLIDL